jgi:hypothetical protein
MMAKQEAPIWLVVGKKSYRFDNLSDLVRKLGPAARVLNGNLEPFLEKCNPIDLDEFDSVVMSIHRKKAAT